LKLCKNKKGNHTAMKSGLTGCWKTLFEALLEENETEGKEF